MAERVEIFEVGPRDGLQNEKREIPVSEKIALVDCLSRAGFSRIEVASFVSPKWVPQMAGSAEVLAGITRAPGVRYAALTPNMRGYGSCVTDGPYDGPTPPAKVAEVADLLFSHGCYEISLGDTIGQGTPDSIARMLLAVREYVPATRLAGHFHDTNGRAIDNIDASLALGIRVFDAAVGGLGGCPYAPGAAGNVATEAVAAHLERLGYDTGLDAAVLNEAAEMARAMRAG